MELYPAVRNVFNSFPKRHVSKHNLSSYCFLLQIFTRIKILNILWSAERVYSMLSDKDCGFFWRLPQFSWLRKTKVESLLTTPTNQQFSFVKEFLHQRSLRSEHTNIILDCSTPYSNLQFYLWLIHSIEVLWCYGIRTDTLTENKSETHLICGLIY